MIETFTYISSELKPLKAHALDISAFGMKEFQVYPFLRKHPSTDIPATVYEGQVIYCSNEDFALSYAKELLKMITDRSDYINQYNAKDVLFTETSLDPNREFYPYKKLVFEALRRGISKVANQHSYRLKHGKLSISIGTKSIKVKQKNISMEEYLNVRGFNSNIGTRMLLVMDLMHHIPWVNDPSIYETAKSKTVIECGQRYLDVSSAIKAYFGNLDRLDTYLDDEQIISFSRIKV
jgi:hypothetical protein